MSELEAWLDKLGHMPTEDIRTLMQQEGCLGECRKANRCPLSQFFYKQGITASVGCHTTVDAYDMIRLENPFTVQAFIKRFDKGEYPELHMT